MPAQHIVVDGSNIATESRQLPSLAQLESALEELRKDFPDAEVTVVVDATFAHRIDPSELPRYEAAALRGELVSPPAGAIGRGDAFLLRIAEKVDGTVLSNDSFQEFHGEHPWLFDRGRLIGATPVPGVGWIFVPRTPVRGPKSRVAVRDADREKARVTEAIAEATREVEDPEATTVETEPKARRARARRTLEKPQAVNDPITFITFIAEHKLGDEVEGVVESFTSHGAVVTFGGVRCYAPLANLAEPPPRSAREVLQRGEKRSFVITALDPYRRGIELALPGVGHVSGRPSDETVEAEVRLSRRSRKAEAERDAEPEETPPSVAVAAPARARSRRPKRPVPTDGPGTAPKPAAAKKATAEKKVAEKKVAAPAAKGRRPSARATESPAATSESSSPSPARKVQGSTKRPRKVAPPPAAVSEEGAGGSEASASSSTTAPRTRSRSAEKVARQPVAKVRAAKRPSKATAAIAAATPAEPKAPRRRRVAG